MVILHREGWRVLRRTASSNSQHGRVFPQPDASPVPFQQVVMAALETPPERKPKTKVKGEPPVAMKPALPWVICAIGTLLLLVLFGSGRAMIIFDIFAYGNVMFALGGRAFGWRYNK